MKTTFKSILCVMLAAVLCAFTLSGCDGIFDSGSSGGGGNHGGGNFVPMDGNASHSKDTDKNSEAEKQDSEDIIYKPPTGGYTKRVALTFDDGPHVERTPKIVDELAKYGYNATFFVVGNRVDGTEYNGGAAMKYAVSKGNEIGIHGYTHSYYYDTCDDATYQSEIADTLKAIRKVLPDYEVKVMRPVGGRITAERVAASPYAVIQWSVDSDDWNNKYVSGDTDEDTARKIEATVNNVMNNVSDGDIILMHDIWSNTYDATVILLERLYEEGYDVVSVSELLGDSMQAGREYYAAVG